MHRSRLAAFVIDCRTDDLGRVVFGVDPQQATAYRLAFLGTPRLRPARSARVAVRTPSEVSISAAPGVIETIAEALKGPFLLAITYAGADGVVTEQQAGRLLNIALADLLTQHDIDESSLLHSAHQLRAALRGAGWAPRPLSLEP